MILNSVRQNNLSVKNSEISLQPYYSAISEKMDNTISEIITLVTIIMGISTASGLILAFKAPRDIENEINSAKQVGCDAQQAADKASRAAEDAKKAALDLNRYIEEITTNLNEKVNEAEKSSADANKAATEAKNDARQVKFETELNDAINRDTTQQKMEALTRLEKDYPKEKRVYVHKGRISSNVEDANSAFDQARLLGLEDEDYYNELARAYYILDDFDKTIEMIKNALKIKQGCWLYINLARTLCSKSECDTMNKEINLSVLEEALGYLVEAEKIDDKEQDIYLVRARILKNINEYYNADKNYTAELNTAVDKAYEMDPELASRYFAKMEFDICRGRENYKDSRTLAAAAFVRLAKNDYQHQNFISAFENNREAFYALYLPVPQNTDYIKQIAENAANFILMFDRSSLQKSLRILDGEKDKAFLDNIQLAAVTKYKTGIGYEVGKVFSYLYVAYGKNGKKEDTITSLIYMMRRGEIPTNKKNIEALVKQIENSKMIFAQINIYLWNIQNSKDEDGLILATEAIRAYNFSQDDIIGAKSWWSNINIVGSGESATVLELLDKLIEKA